MTTRRRGKGGIKEFAQQVSRNFRWIDRTLRDVVDAVNHLAQRVAVIEEQLGIIPPPPPKPRAVRQEERMRWLMTESERLGLKTSAPTGDSGADSTHKGKSAATDIRGGPDQTPEGTPMLNNTNDTAGGAE